MRRPTLLTLFLIVFVDLIGFGLIIPIIPYLADKFGASGLQLGFVFASFSFMQFFFAPVWGSLSDRFGRRPIILISLAGSTLSYVMFAYSSSIMWVLASRIFAGICGANISVANAYVADITSEKDRSKGMGMIGAAFGIGFIVGPAIVSVLRDAREQSLGFVAAGICLVNLLCAIWMLPESLPIEKRSKQVVIHFNLLTKGWANAFTKETLVILMIVTFLTNIALTMWETSFAYFLQRDPHFGLPKEYYSNFLIYMGVIIAGIQGGTLGRLTKRFQEKRLLQVGLIAFILSLFLIPFSTSVTMLVGVLFFLAVGSALCRPLLYSLISKNSAAHEQGEILGVAQSVSSLTRIIGPIVGGLVLDHMLNLPYWVGGTCVVLAFFLVFRLVPSPLKNAN